jgi:hypothetical protein
MTKALFLGILLSLAAPRGFIYAADIVSDKKGFKWHVDIRELKPNSKGKTLDFQGPVDRKKLPIEDGNCFISILPLLKTGPLAPWEQSVNLTCNSFAIGGLCQLGEKNSGWISGVVEGKRKFIRINITCDSLDDSFLRESK